MKNVIYLFLVLCFVYACGPTQGKDMAKGDETSDTIRIANDSLDFELLVFDTGFERWMAGRPPMESYNLSYLESRNRSYVNRYNLRARNPAVYGRLYPQPINYESDVDYGLELNYMLFNYFEFFQEKYNQRL